MYFTILNHLISLIFISTQKNGMKMRKSRKRDQHNCKCHNNNNTAHRNDMYYNVI